MWTRISGKPSNTKDNPSSQIDKRNDDKDSSKQSRTGSSVTFTSDKDSSTRDDKRSSKSARKSSSRGDDRDRGFNPTSTSYSSTTQSPYPGTASASVATASGNHNDEPYIPPGLVRNASLANQMPKSKSSRDERARDERRDLKNERRSNRDEEERRRDRVDQERERGNKRSTKDDRLEKLGNSTKSSKFGSGHGDIESMETSKGPAEFSEQVGASSFSQFPGQYDGGIPHANGNSSEHTISSHVQDQFPGQFPTQSTAPYRPPAAASEGGPGLAAEYYGDAGESVAEQPGNRVHTPSLIIGAEPHLQAALAVAAPPPEPSASGGVGAAASFFSGEFDEHQSTTSHGQQTSSTFATAPVRPQGSHHASSAPAVPTVGGAALGAAAGYFIGSQTPSHTHRPSQTSSVGGVQQEQDSDAYQRPPFPTAESYYSNASWPPRPGKQSSQSSNAPLYVAGAAGLAAATYDQQMSSHHNSLRPQNQITPMAQRHRHHGPIGAVVNFFKDPDGVAEFEEYSEIIGICKYCFAPGSSPRDAPRKHHYRRKRSSESLGRVDKESRYHSSENESRRRKDKSWLATGLAGYGLAKVGESLFKQKNDFDDTYSVKTGHRSSDRRSQQARRRSQSKDRIESGRMSDGKVFKEDSHGSFSRGPKTSSYEAQRHTRSRPRLDDHKSGLVDAATGVIVGLAEAPSARRRRSQSPKRSSVYTQRKDSDGSLERDRKSHQKEKRGFFSIGSASSSSSSVNMVHGSERHRKSKRSSTKSKDDKKAEAAILGIGAAAAALALSDNRKGHSKKGVKALVGRKESRESRSRSPKHDHHSEDEVWESAPEEDYESADSALAYGGPRRKGSHGSLSSDSSGTNKWGWRWGNTKERRGPPAKGQLRDHGTQNTSTSVAGAVFTGAALMSPDQYQIDGVGSNYSHPLQQVFPISTSDPTRFDVGTEASVPSSSLPAIVPIQHPQPIAPVSAVLYSGQPCDEQSYSAPTGLDASSRQGYISQPVTIGNARFTLPEPDIPSSIAGGFQHVKEVESDLGLRRRDTSPAKLGDISVSSSKESRRRASTKDDASVVKFEFTEEQEEKDRLARRRKKREDRERREREEREQIDKLDKVSEGESSKQSESWKEREDSSQRSSDHAWAVPVAAGVIGAAVGAAAVKDKSGSEETREERRERRRREREREEAEDEEAAKKRERRRKEREREREHFMDESVRNEPGKSPDEDAQTSQEADGQVSGAQNQRSIWQEAAKPTKSTIHEDYGAFFRPFDLDDSSDQVKVTSADANADIDFDRTPAIVTVAPKEFRHPDIQPIFSPADTDDVIDSTKLSFPVPRLRLLEPTPPSSRTSTPISQPRDSIDEDIEEPSRDSSRSKVTWGDNQTHEYDVVSAEENEDERHGDLESSLPAGIVKNGLIEESEPLEEPALPQGQEKATECSDGIKSRNAPESFSDDFEFAATLAASAEDAGFDPSIVIDDPRYARRGSPPGSNDHNMPGGFYDDEPSALSRRDRKKKDRSVKPQDELRESIGRDDEAVVQNIISQVEDSETHQSKGAFVDNLDDDLRGGKKSKSKKSKKARKDTGSRDELFEPSETVAGSQETESREMYDSPTEDTVSVNSGATLSNEGGSTKKGCKKSKRGSISFDDAASTVSASSTKSSSTESKSNPKKGSVWDRVLGRLPQGNGTEDLPKEANIADFEEPRKKSKKAKERRSTRDASGDAAIASRSNVVSEGENGQPATGSSIGQDTGRISQDLPAKVPPPAAIDSTQEDDMLIGSKDQEFSPSTVAEAFAASDHTKDYDQPEKVDEGRVESFLDMRPEPPPPPDSDPRVEEPPDPLATVGLPVHPHPGSEDRIRQYSQVQSSDPLPSPTAVPFDFRFSRPRPSIRSARSMSQTPPSSPHIAADMPYRARPRPRSTEFKSSNEFKPLMLVERHRSHQESAPEEAYPSLPSSRTTSRTSSVHDPEEAEYEQRGDYEMDDSSHRLQEKGSGTPINTTDSIMEPDDLLDSKQATPTAASFPSPIVGHDVSPDSVLGGSSPESAANEHFPNTPSSVRNTISDEQAMQALPQDEDDRFQRRLESMAVDQDVNPSIGDTTMHEEDLTGQGSSDLAGPDSSPEVQNHFQQPVEHVVSPARVAQIDDSSVGPKAELNHQGPGLERVTEVLPQKELDPSTQDVDDVRPAVEATATLGNDALPEEEFDPREDFIPKGTKKGKKSKDKSSKPELPEERVALQASKSTKGSKDTVPYVPNPEEVQQIQEQDAQDAVDSWFAPAPSLKKDKKKRRKEVAEDFPESSEPVTSSNRPEEIIDFVKPAGLQEGESLTQGMSPDQVEDIMASAAQDLENVGKDKLPPLATTPNRDPMAGLLERRQSKSKSKKGKKGRKSTLQDDPSPSMSPGAGVAGVGESFSGQLGESDPPSSKPTAESELSETVDERRKHSDPELSAGSIPQSSDRALDLPTEQGQAIEVLPTSAMGVDEDDILAENPLEAPRTAEKVTSPIIEASREVSSPKSGDVAVESFALSSRRKGKKKRKEEPGLLGDVVSNLATEDTFLPPEEIPITTALQQTQGPAKDLSTEIPEGREGAEKEWGGPDNKKNGKNGKKSKKATLSSTNDLSMSSGKPSEVTTQSNTQDLAEEPVDELPTAPLEDEWAGFSTKKKGKQSKQPKRDLTNEADASTDIQTGMSMIWSTAQNATDEPASHQLETVGALKESQRAEDDWTGFSSSKTTKKGKRSKQNPRDDADAKAKAETGMPSPVAVVDVIDEQQPQDSADTVGWSTSQQELGMSEGEFPGFGSTIEGNKSKEMRDNLAIEDEKDVDNRIDAGLADFTPGEVENTQASKLNQQSDTSNSHNEAKAVDDERGGFASRKEVEAEKDVSINAEEMRDVETKHPSDVAAPGVNEVAHRSDEPVQDVAEIPSQVPHTTEGSPAFGIDYEAQDPSPEALKPMSELTGAREAESIAPTPPSASHAATTTSRDVAAILEPDENHVSNGEGAAQSIFPGHAAEPGGDESDTDHQLLHPDERGFSQAVNDVSKGSENETEEFDVIDQYVGDQHLPHEDTIHPVITESGTQELDFIDQYANEKASSPPPKPFAAFTNTARAVEHLLGSEHIDEPSTHEREAAPSSSAVHVSSTADQTFKSADLDWDMPKKKKGKKSKQREDYSWPEAEVKDLGEPLTAPAEADPPSSPPAVEDAQWDVPKKRKSKKSSKKESTLNAPEAEDSPRTSIPSTDAETLVDREPVIGMTQEVLTKKSKKDEKKTPSKARCEDKAASEGLVDSPRAQGSAETEGENAMVFDKALPADELRDTGLQGPKDFGQLTDVESVQASQAEEVLHDGDKRIPPEIKPKKGKNDKKKAKEAKIPTSDNQESAAPIPEDDLVAGTKTVKNNFQEDKLVGEPMLDPEKTADSSQPASLNDEVSPVSPGTIASHEIHDPIEAALTQNFETDYPIHADGTAIADDVEPPFHDFHDYPHAKPEEQLEELAYEGTSSTLPIHEDAPTALDKSEARSENDRRLEDTESPSFGIKETEEDKEHREKARALALDDERKQEDAEAAHTEPTVENVQDELSNRPIHKNRADWSRPETPIEEIEPLEVIDPEDNLLKPQTFGEVKSLATEAQDDQSVEAEQDAFPPDSEDKNDSKYSKEKYSKSGPQKFLTAIEEVHNPTVATEAERRDVPIVENQPQDAANASGERQSMIEARTISTTADQEREKSPSVSDVTEIFGTKAEDDFDNMTTKEKERVKKAERGFFSDLEPETDRSNVERTIGPLVPAGSTLSGQVTLGEQTSGNIDAVEDIDNAHTSTGTAIEESSAVPVNGKGFDTNIEDEPWNMPTKKSKKGKGLKREKRTGSGPGVAGTVEKEEMIPTVFAGSSRDHEPTVEEQPRDKANALKDVGDIDSIAKTDIKESLPALDTKDTVEVKDEDELWGMPIKKGKKSKRQRKNAQKIPEDVETAVPASSDPSEAAQDFMQYSQDEETAAATGTPTEDGLLGPQEQRQYDREYAQELGRQGVDTPQDTKVELSSSATECEATETQLQTEHKLDLAQVPAQEDYQARRRSTPDLSMTTQKSESGIAQQPLERSRDHARVVDQDALDTPLTPMLASPNPVAESEQPGHGQEFPQDFEKEEGEISQVPTNDLPTPAAEVVMLDAQEQQDYDNEYAKELQRQLSPLQEEGRQDIPAEEAYSTPTFQPSIDSVIETPLVERTPLARPPPLEDIAEESRSRSGSVQGTSPRQDDEVDPFRATKKSKKGKKSRKQQQPVIWEDDTATPPVEQEANQGLRAPSASNEQADLDEPFEHQYAVDSSVITATRAESSEAPAEAEDYFALQPRESAEEDIGRDPQHDEFRRSLSTDVLYSNNEGLYRHEAYPDTQEIEDAAQRTLIDEKPDPESVGDPYRPTVSTPPISEEADNDLGRAPTKKSKNSKKSREKKIVKSPSPSKEDSEQFLDHSRPSRSPTEKLSGQTSGPQEYSSQPILQIEEEPLLEGEEAIIDSRNSKTIGDSTAAAALSAAAAGLTAEGLTRRDSKKGSKKGKKGKKSTRWADPESNPPEAVILDIKKDASLEDAEQGSAPENQRGIRDWHENAGQQQPAHQESAIKSWQDFNDTPLQSPSAITSPSPLTEATDDHRLPGQSTHSAHRDSAINVSDSPIISEEVPIHRILRDSGYPETESSPRLDSNPIRQGVWSEKETNNTNDIQSKEDTQEYDQSYRTPVRRTSVTPPSTFPVQALSDFENSEAKPPERHRRSRSYDSDDSADSGFDIQRRRRRQPISKEAREPSPVSSTTKDRSSALFDSSPSARQEVLDRSHEEPVYTPHRDSLHQEPTWSFDTQDSASEGHQDLPRDSSSSHVPEPRVDQSTYNKLAGHHDEPSGSLFGGPVRQDEDFMFGSGSPTSSEVRGRQGRLNTISEDSPERWSLDTKDKRALSDVGSPESGGKERRVGSPPALTAESYVSTKARSTEQSRAAVNKESSSDEFENSRNRNAATRHSDLPNPPYAAPKQGEGEHRTASAASVQSDNSIHAFIRTPDQVRSASGQSYRSSGTPPLRRVDRSVSGDLRGASKLGEAKLRANTSEAELDPAVNSIPSSSTYDPVTDKGKARADMADVYEGWGDVRGQSPMSPTRPPSMRKRQSMQLLDLETRLDQLVSENRLLQSQKSTAERTLQEQTRDHSQQRHAYEEALGEHKRFLAQKDSELDEMRGIVEDWQNKVAHLTEVNEGLGASRGIDDEHHERYRQLETDHLHLRERHSELTTGMDALVQREVASHLEAKNSELQRLRDELESAKQQVRSLQQQLLASRESEDFVERDEDYFDSQCQSLCQHVQQWVLRFSKFSDMKACYRASEIRDETKLDRMENAILDGTDVDIYLQDRVKRRDVFMAVVMTMIFEYIFTRYLFGMDREQRQKLKNLEKTLQEIGPISAVCKWRATTLTLLMRREDFAKQRTTDTEAIVQEVYDTLATFLPPPSHLVAQIQDSLRKVINSAADLSIEMRTQRADYQMLPPLQPDYDTNGDLAQKVYFNALTMNERSGATTSNQALQEQGAVVRMVLFPLVVKNEEDDEQIVVCPAQVLTADSKAKKTVRVMSVQGSTQGGRSEASFAGSEGGMF